MRRSIRDLREKEHVESTFLVRDKSFGPDRNGKFVANLTLVDATGEVNARIFEKVDNLVSSFESGDVIWLKGFVQLYQNRKQIIVNDIRRANESEFKMTDLVAELGGDPSDHMRALEGHVDLVGDRWIKNLINQTLSDSAIRTKLLSAPAAKSIHHAYRGGLIEHIRGIADVMVSLKKHYAFLNLDYLIFGAIYHDIGKIFELDISDGIRYTTSGRLVGHMNQACQMIDQFADGMDGFPEEIRNLLKHIVLSHHGRIEYGSPKLPMMIEALVVSMIDDLDSKLNTLFHFLRNETQTVPPTEKWSHYHSGFDRYFYLDVFRNTLPPETEGGT